MKPVVNAMIGVFQSLTAFVLEGIGRQIKFFGKLSDVFAQVFGFIMPLVKNAGATLITTFFTIVNALKFVMDNFHKVFDVIGDIVGGAIDFITGGIESLVNAFIDGVNSIISAYNDLASEVPMLSTVGTLGEFSFESSGMGDMKTENIAKKQREKMDKARVSLAENIAGEGAAKAVKNFQNAVEGVPDGLRTAGDKAVDLGNNLQDTAEDLRNSEDATVGSLSKSAKDALGGVVGGGKEKPQTKKQGKGMLRQLKMLRKEQRKQRQTPQGEKGKTVIEEGAINVNEASNPDETSKAIFRGIKGRGGSVQ
jgi:phage-related protein